MKSQIHLLVLTLFVFSIFTFSIQSQPCEIPDNGTGTVTLPPIGCDYLSPDEVWLIYEGLPPGSTIEFDGPLTNFICGCPICSLPLTPGECEGVGGPLGGNFHCFEATLDFLVTGTSDLAGFVRSISVPVSCEVHTGPRTPGDPEQTFPNEMYRFYGELLGDPDFCTFNITAGTDYGLPSPGQTILTDLGNGNFNVDSFFDITYQIEFEGCPGSQLDGYSGTTTATIRVQAGEPYSNNDWIDPGPDFWIVPESPISIIQPGGPGGDVPVIPADFFEPGSDPFDGVIALQGESHGSTEFPNADAIVERTSSANLPVPYPSTDVIPTEIVELSLVGTAPITVTYGGINPELWNVELELPTSPQPQGSMSITKNDANGGVFDYSPLFVYPQLIFTKVDPPNTILTYDLNDIEFTNPFSYPWEHSPIGNDFNPIGPAPLELFSLGGDCELYLVPYLLREDDFWVNVDFYGNLQGGGSGYNDGEWYEYPNTGWWNIWFYDHPYDSERKKGINVSFTISGNGYAYIVINWSTPEWSGQGTPGRPPLPGDEPEELYIVRSEETLFEGQVSGSTQVNEYFEIPDDYNPEWISIDIMTDGYGFDIPDGIIEHVCFSPDEGGEEYDLGDAPEGQDKIAYPSTGVTGNFPTCISVTPSGYVAHGPGPLMSYFGPSVDLEMDGNANACPNCFPIYDDDECFGDGDAGLIIPDSYTIDASNTVVLCPTSAGTSLGVKCNTAVWGADIDIHIENTSTFDQFVNVLFDWNQNGYWMDDPGSACTGTITPEHVLINFIVPAGYSGPLSGLNPPSFTIGPNSGYIWSRFTISDTPVTAGDWDGSGVFGDGETEDYLILVDEPQTGIKYEQPPDLTPNGIDVYATADMYEQDPPIVLADDFLCTETGNITDIHIWGSWLDDVFPYGNMPEQVRFTLSIHADIPDPDGPGPEYSMPGEILWLREFNPGDFDIEWYNQGDEGWFWPFNDSPNDYQFPGDTWCIKYNFYLDPDDYFYQEGTESDPIVYWLDVQAVPQDIYSESARFGWKTSTDHWNDDAVWGLGNEPFQGPWYELRYPLGHEYENQSIDLAFEITTEGPTEEYDFGDAPDLNYKTLLGNNGARHIPEPGFCLGGDIDTENNGQPDAFAKGDDNDGNDDEDGVDFITPLIPGQLATVKVFLTEPTGGNGMLDPWIDFNMNGVFDQPVEHLCGGISCVLNPGNNFIDFIVPASTPINSQTFARFRLSRNGGLIPFGPASNGEVEDYMVFIHEPIDDVKMHYPQYPDPFGWDINITSPNVLADDWMCTESGYVEDFHFWVSWLNDVVPEVIEDAIQKIHISIHTDIPADPPQQPYSMPGILLWERDFVPGEFNYSWYLEGPQGWYDPVQGLILPDNHYNCYRIDIDNFDQPFIQQEGTIYWMDVSIELVDGSGGADQVTVTLDGVDPAISPYQIWTESNVDLVIVDFDGPISYSIDVDRIWLFNAQLNADLSNLPGNISSVEVDIYDGCYIGCTEATLYEGSSLVDQQSNIVTNAESTLVLTNSGGFVPDLLTVSSYQGAVIEIRIYYEDSQSYQVGWKTSTNHWNDDGVYDLPDLGWQELIDPFTEESLDMAFAITGNPVNNLDWGDAPDNPQFPGYPTLLVHNGARHVVNNLIYLGDTIDTEGNGIPDSNALGDDNDNVDDEDGIVFTSPIIPGFNATVDVEASVDGILNAWLDFGNDIGWAEIGDHIFINEPLNAGINHLSFNVPSDADTSFTIARFRFSTFTDISYVGLVGNGEVEDIGVFIQPPPEKWWLQEPDLSDYGMDVDATAYLPVKYPSNILADDFYCDQTGPITRISIWGSWYHDHYPWFEDPGSVIFTLSIHKDIPAEQSPNGYSMPGEVLWLGTFGPGQFMYELYADNLYEGWYDPAIPIYEPLGDTQCWKYTFNIQEPFIQQGTPGEPKVYWLDVQASPMDDDPECRFGWKTSPTHWNDDAVWVEGIEPYNGDQWNELIYPIGHPLAGHSIDLAFEIIGYEDPYILVDLNAIIEGPFNGVDMNTDLNDVGLLPLAHPYGGAPWLYAGTENVSTMPNTDIVDWVIVELRETPGGPVTADVTTRIARKASFLLKDNSIVAIDGMSYLKFYKTISDNLFSVILHRNHLGVMSKYPMIPVSGVYSYDFTTPAGQAYQDGQKNLVGGVFGLFGGDGVPNGDINIGDKLNTWEPEAGTWGYKPGDFNLDIQIDNKDKDDIWVPNLGEGTKVP